MTKAADMSHGELLNDRKWGASVTIDQMRAQIAHEQVGCPVPFVGAEWDGYCYRGPSWVGHSHHA